MVFIAVFIKKKTKKYRVQGLRVGGHQPGRPEAGVVHARRDRGARRCGGGAHPHPDAQAQVRGAWLVQTDGRTEEQADGQTGRQTDRQADGWTGPGWTTRSPKEILGSPESCCCVGSKPKKNTTCQRPFLCRWVRTDRQATDESEGRLPQACVWEQATVSAEQTARCVLLHVSCRLLCVVTRVALRSVSVVQCGHTQRGARGQGKGQAIHHRLCRCQWRWQEHQPGQGRLLAAAERRVGACKCEDVRVSGQEHQPAQDVRAAAVLSNCESDMGRWTPAFSG
jgi:hypothetical protein